MSLVAYLEITDEELQPDAPILSSIGTRFRDNPIAIATRDSNAPWLNGVGASQLLTGSGDWTVPAEVFRIRVWCFGAGGGGGGASASIISANSGGSGGSTSFGGVSANGGGGGRGSTSNDTRNGSNGTTRGVGAPGGGGGVHGASDERATATDGQPGQLTMSVLQVSPGETISYSCGSGGSGGDYAGGSGAEGGNGANGFIYLEW